MKAILKPRFKKGSDPLNSKGSDPFLKRGLRTRKVKGTVPLNSRGQYPLSYVLLILLLFTSGKEFIARIPRRQLFGVGDRSRHIEAEAGQHDKAGEIPVLFEFILRRMVGVIVEFLEGLDGEFLGLALDLHACPDGERGNAGS